MDKNCEQMEFGTDFAARTDDQNNWDIPGS